MKRYLAFYACAALLLLLWAAHGRFVSWSDSRSRARATPLQRPLDTLPFSVGEWRGRPSDLPDDVIRAAEADEFIYRTYYDADGRPVTLYITYYGGLYRNIPHGPETCYPMSGWKVLDSHLATDPAGKCPHQQLLFGNQLERHLVFYWYYLNGKRMAGESRTRLGYAVNLLRGSGGSIVQVEISADAAGRTEAARERLENFRSALEPLLKTILPAPQGAAQTQTGPNPQ